MYDNRDLEEDYVRRLRLAQESGDTRRVPRIDESRVKYGTLLSTEAIVREARRFLFLTREGYE
jgi:hypothetical protein